jgi:lipoprotein-releasing system ATP-binding protein
MKKPILSVKEICKSFYHPTQVDVIKGVSLEVYPHDSIAITGASGEGKSTLLSIIGLLDDPSKGTLEVYGKHINNGSVTRLRNQSIGFVFQNFFLLEDYSVIENILMPARIARKSTKPGSKAYQHGEYLLEKVKLTHRKGFPVKLLSGGEKQRVALARALCNDPQLILADEPSGNLDHATSIEIYELLFSCLKESDKALITVTHDLELAHRCQRHYHLEDGKLEMIRSSPK